MNSKKLNIYFPSNTSCLLVDFEIASCDFPTPDAKYPLFREFSMRNNSKQSLAEKRAWVIAAKALRKVQRLVENRKKRTKPKKGGARRGK